MKSPTSSLRLRFLLLLSVLALLAAACGGGGDGDAAGDGDGGGEAGEVSILDAFTEPQDVAGFQALIDAFTEETGIEVQREGSPAFEETAVARVEGGNPPDIIMHPQPGLITDFQDRGTVQALGDNLDIATIEGEYVPGLVDIGRVVPGDDSVYGIPIRLSYKSLVWYAQDDFDAAGYTVPETQEDLLALSDQIVANGGVPWCIGIESDQATGWPATDWIEDFMLRLHGPEVYDQWINHDLLFDSPEVREAFQRLEEIWFNPDYALGGTPNIIQTGFAAAPLPMFEDPPGCFLHRQASFIQQSFPEDTEFGTDYNFFYFPEITDGAGRGSLIAGDLAAVYTDNPNAFEFIQFAATAEAQELWAAEGGFLCANAGCDTGAYPNESFAQQGELLASSDFARFDGSDLMPGAVGAGAFWTEVTAWINGSQDLDTTLANIDAAWPE